MIKTNTNNTKQTQPIQWRDANGFDPEGYDRNGFDRLGYDRQGYDRNGFRPDGQARYRHNKSLIDMIQYNYEEAIFKDIATTFWSYKDDALECATYEEAIDFLDESYCCDNQVTGNEHGSYFFDRLKSSLAVASNWDLFQEVLEELGPIKNNNPETADVVIRCYLLRSVLIKFLELIDFESNWKHVTQDENA